MAEHPVTVVALQFAVLRYSIRLWLLASATYRVLCVASTANAVGSEEGRRFTVATHALVVVL